MPISMRSIDSLAALEKLYGTPGAASLSKVADHLTPLYHKWIMASRLCILSTVGPDGTDGSPRGDDGTVVLPLGPRRLALPDWRGNQRLDTLRNIVEDGRVSCLFMVPGSNTVVRVNGKGFVTDDAEVLAQFDRGGKQPATAIVIYITEVYTQCARALMRAEIWTAGDQSNGLPSAGDILAEVSRGLEGSASYDAEWGARAAKTMW